MTTVTLSQNSSTLKVKKFIQFINKNRTFAIGFLFVSIVLVCSIFPGLIVSQDPYDQAPADRYKPPFWMEGGSTEHLLGTDSLGRDLLSRTIWGFRPSVMISVMVVLISVTVGLIVGITAGVVGGPVGNILMRIVDIQMGIPMIVLLITFLSLLPYGVISLTLVLALATWAPYARSVQASVIHEVNADYIKAARIMGASPLRIVFNYVSRNIVPTVAVSASVDIANIIILETLMDFFGLGIQPPTPTWGTVIADGFRYIVTAWWVPTLPGFFVSFAVLGFTLLGDGITPFIDPRRRGR
jgi:peptide/nickel transport system permease protein